MAETGSPHHWPAAIDIGAASFGLLADAVSDSALYLLDTQGRVATWNAGAERLKQYTADEIIGQHFSCFYPEEERAAGVPAAELARALKDGRRELQGWRIRKDGSRFRARVFITPILAPGGQHLGFGKVTQDLSRRRDEHLLTSILDNTLAGVICTDGQRRIVTVNHATERIFDYTAEQLLGNSIELLLPDTAEMEAQREAEASAAGPGADLGYSQVDGRRADGSAVPLELAIGEFIHAGERHMTYIARDISLRKKLEEQLRQSQKMEAIGKLAGGVAHDFNNMLTVIIGYSQIGLMNMEPDHPLHEPLSEIGQAADRAALITKQLLAFSRQQVLSPIVMDLNAVLRDTEKMLRRLIGEDIVLTLLLADELDMVVLDSGQLVQVVMNLAVNARDAMPRGGQLSIQTANFHVSAERARMLPDYHEGPNVMLSVSDTGVGMSPEVVSRIFEPFFTTKGPGEGTGLGLSTVYGIVKQSGGNIEVYSEPGQGTAFRLYFPAAPGAAGAAAGTTAPQARRGNETILLVEDDTAVRKVALSVLQNLGYTVWPALDGAAALALLAERSERIDLLLTDLVMPGLSGREVAEAVLLRRPGTKVLYMSGYTDDAVIRHGLVQQGINFLQKPFTPLSLSGKVREVLDGTGAAGGHTP